MFFLFLILNFVIVSDAENIKEGSGNGILFLLICLTKSIFRIWGEVKVFFEAFRMSENSPLKNICRAAVTKKQPAKKHTVNNK